MDSARVLIFSFFAILIYRTCPILRIGIIECPKTPAIVPRRIPTGAPNPVTEVTADAAPSGPAKPVILNRFPLQSLRSF